MKALRAAGAQTELINLYDWDYKGCTGCLACKVKNGKSIGRCAVNDGLRPVLDKIHACDSLLLGSPIYFGNVTGMILSFWERLLFQYLSYDNYTGSKKTAFIYTMSVEDTMLKQYFKHVVHTVSTETLQVSDYSKYHLGNFNEADRTKRRNDVFPKDCKKAILSEKQIFFPVGIDTKNPTTIRVCRLHFSNKEHKTL